MRRPSLEIRIGSDATDLTGESPCILIHLLSDALVWGLGFTQDLESRWPICSATILRRKCDVERRVVLGEVLWTEAAPNITIGHLVAERSRGKPSSGLDMEAFALCLDAVAVLAKEKKAEVHAPPLGTGLVAATWSTVRALMQAQLVERGITVVIHCLSSRHPL